MAQGGPLRRRAQGDYHRNFGVRSSLVLQEQQKSWGWEYSGSLCWSLVYNLKQISMKSTKKDQFAERFSESQANFSQKNQQEQQHQSEGKPIQLIRIKPSGKIEIMEQALSIIASYDEPVGFVSLVGKMRTGKSCLLNKILHLSGEGFKVDPSTNSCTEGIWMWSEPYFNQQFNNYVFFLDTEGTDSLVKNADNDTKIFTISLLISTYFIYNSVGTINEIALSQLEMVTTLSKYIKTGDAGGEADSEQIHKFMPKFLWLLRDFMLKIENQSGKRISPSQYLENCLNDRAGNKGSEQSRKIKKSIMSYFPNRECLTLVQPVDDEDQLQRLNKLPDHCLRRQFMDGVAELRAKIMSNTGPKIYEGKPLSGANFSVMIDSYVNSFNSGKVPNIRTAWQQIAEDQGSNAFNKALEKFESIVNEQLGDNQPKGEEIYQIIFRLKEETMKEYEEATKNNKNQEYSRKLKAFLKQKETEILEQNNRINQAKNTEILYTHAQKLKSRIESNYYMQSKKHREELQADINEVTVKYNKQAKGGRKGELITEFLTTVTPMITSMKADNTEAEEKIRNAEIAMNEQNRRIQQLQLDKLSKEKQMKSQENISNLKKTASKVSKEQPERDKGCCAGGGCQIM